MKGGAHPPLRPVKALSHNILREVPGNEGSGNSEG